MTQSRLTAWMVVSVLTVFLTMPAPIRAQEELARTKQTPNSAGNRILEMQRVIPFRLIDESQPITPTMAPLVYQLELTSRVADGLGQAGIQLDGLNPTANAPTVDVEITNGRLERDEDGGVSIRKQARSGALPDAGEADELEHHDPWEGFNGKIFEFNRRMDKYALKPVAKEWKKVVPEQAQIMIANAFDNVSVVPRVVNNLLQGKWEGASRELSRFLINSTAGVAGFLDPAKDVWHIAKSPADFGQTLGKWGVGPGPYLVLPFTDPLTVRDGVGKLIDRAIDPLSYVLPLIPALSLAAGNRINERAINYELFVDFEDGVLDAYTAVRDGYLQRRERMLIE